MLALRYLFFLYSIDGLHLKEWVVENIYRNGWDYGQLLPDTERGGPTDGTATAQAHGKQRLTATVLAHGT